jgi:hypothetical protein
MLHARAGYRCARPNSACNARPVHTVGSIATEMGYPPDVCFPPDSDHCADIPDRQLRANFGSERTHSITSSARPSSVGGMVRPIDFAVLRLITSSNVVGCSIGISLGLAPATILLT